jgi:hypothetical protein
VLHKDLATHGYEEIEWESPLNASVPCAPVSSQVIMGRPKGERLKPWFFQVRSLAAVSDDHLVRHTKDCIVAEDSRVWLGFRAGPCLRRLYPRTWCRTQKSA